MEDNIVHSILVIDSDASLKVKLKATQLIQNIVQVRTFKEAEKALSSSMQKFTMVFVSMEFPQDEIKGFIKLGRNMESCEDAPFVLLMKKIVLKSKQRFSAMAYGCDGLLAEPFSIENVKDVLGLIDPVRLERERERDKEALGEVVTDVMDLLDKIALVKSKSFSADKTQTKLKELCTILEELTDEQQKMYFDISLDSFEQAKVIEDNSDIKPYHGISNRVRKRMEDKVIESISSPDSSTPPTKK